MPLRSGLNPGTMRRAQAVSPRRDGGYALVAAVASLAVFAAIALAVQSATRLAVVDVAAEQAQLQAGAAADAGIAMAIAGLLGGGPAGGWSIDGRTHTRRFGVARLTIRVEDEWGKVPLGRLDETRATRLMEAAGLEGEALLIARDSLLDWIDDDEEKRPFGAEEDYYRAAGLRPPNGFPASVGELRLVRGVGAGVAERIAPFVTPYTPVTGFDPRYADPRAVAIMSTSGAGGPEAIDRAREARGQRTALAFTDPRGLTGRPLTIAVEAVLPDGRATRRVTIDLTGAPSRPYRVRAAE